MKNIKSFKYFEEVIYNPKETSRKMMSILEYKKIEFKPTKLKIGWNKMEVPLGKIFFGKVIDAIEKGFKVKPSSCKIHIKSAEKTRIFKALDLNPKNFYGITEAKVSFESNDGDIVNVLKVSKDSDSADKTMFGQPNNVDLSNFLKSDSKVILDINSTSGDKMYIFIIELELSKEENVTSIKKGENIGFSNRLVYWNTLHKKFKNNSLSETEKKDYKDLCNAKTWWVLELDGSNIADSKKKEYKKRFSDFEESLDRVYKRIPDDFFKQTKDLKKRETSYPGMRNERVRHTNDQDDLVNKSSFRAKSILKDSKLLSKEEADTKLSTILQKYNDWLESIDIPWNEISTYVDKKVYPSKINQQFQNQLDDSLNYFFGDLQLSTSEFQEAKTEFGKVKGDSNTLIKKFEETLGSSYYDLEDSLRSKIENLIENLKKSINKKDLEQTKKLYNELSYIDKKGGKSVIKFKR